MELQTWVDCMELWIDLTCSWVGFIPCSFTKILRNEDMGSNLQITWEEELFSKENIWEPIYIELEKKFLEQIRDGYPFGKKLRKKFHNKLN
jgi:hypothetical protein